MAGCGLRVAVRHRGHGVRGAWAGASSASFVSALLVTVSALASLPRLAADFDFARVDQTSLVTVAGASALFAVEEDACGVCGGDGTSCEGCDGVENSGELYDACGKCLHPTQPVGASAFNASCVDCAGDTPHGPRVLDDCGVCRDPADALFSRAGIPDYHLGGCIGCDGEPFSNNKLDACGVCGGDGCGGSKPSWCCDCADEPFGLHVVDLCCECRHRTEWWGAITAGAKGPPESHQRAVTLWETGRELVALADAEAQTLAAVDGQKNRSDDVTASYRRAIALFDAGWGALSEPEANDQSECYRREYISNAMGSAARSRDICGMCPASLVEGFEPGGGGEPGEANRTCLGCEGTPIQTGGLFYDDCGKCGGEDAGIDACGVCGGDNSTCPGCDGVRGSFLTAGFDACGACVDFAKPEQVALVNHTCNGCDGRANSGKTFDWCCACDGGAGHNDTCYRAMVANGDAVSEDALPFDPYSDEYETYFNASGLAMVDQCGECLGWGYNGSTCVDCEGNYGTGKVLDGCGVCGGDCSTCLANETGLQYDCEPPGRGWTGMDRTCSFVRTRGPSGREDDPWLLWPAFNNGTDKYGNKLPRNQSWYERVNAPGAKNFTQVAVGECRMYLEPPKPPGPREIKEWVVKVFGKEEGPFSLNELESGSIAVTDSTTGEKISSPLTPTTLVARVMTYRQMQEISYGFTSQYPERIQAWKLRSAERIVSSTNEPGVENKVLVEGDATELWHNGSGAKFMPMAVMPGMEKIIYPYCTGSTFRGGKHRLHGKKLPGNYLGIITSENPHNDSMNMPWNPLDEYIYDIATSWIDQKCTCSTRWEYQSEPIAPTCPRVWFPWSGWVEDGWFVSHNTFVPDENRYRLETKRSWAGGGWRVSGGWWVQDYGGGGSSQYGSATSDIYNQYGTAADKGYGAVRGPARIDSAGAFSVRTVAPVGSERDEAIANARLCDSALGYSAADGAESTSRRRYDAARLSPPRRNTSGAIWGDNREAVLEQGGWETNFTFVILFASETCVDAHAVSRSFTEEVRTRTHRNCERKGGDGFAFVVRDDTDAIPTIASVGAPGPGLGYQGLRHSLAVEFDTWHNPRNDEPYERHVAVHTMGAAPNDAHHGARLASVQSDAINFADGEAHMARVRFSPNASSDALNDAFASGACRGAAARLAHFTKSASGDASCRIARPETWMRGNLSSAECAATDAGGAAESAAMIDGEGCIAPMASSLLENCTNPGLLEVFLDDADEALLTVPLSLETVLRPNSTRAWVGFTSGTGESWQAVDVLSWSFESRGNATGGEEAGGA